MDKRKRAEILETPAGPRLNILVEKIVFGRTPCICRLGAHTLADDGTCTECHGTPVAAWSESCRASLALREYVLQLDFQKRMRFLGYLGEAISHRLHVGKVQPHLWILYIVPADFARAAVLTISDGVYST